jgi:glycosyltransferase involved in cell wall biosynthesis
MVGLKEDLEIDIFVMHGYFEYNEYRFHKNYNYPRQLRVHYFGFPYFIRILRFLKWDKGLNNVLIENLRYLLKNKRYDYGWISLGCSAEIVNLIHKSGIKIVQEINEFPRLMMKEGDFQIYLKKICPLIDILFPMTLALKSYLEKFLRQDAKSVLIPMTIDLNRFKDIGIIKNDKKFIIMYVGLMNKKKDGVDILLRSFSKLSAKIPNAELILIGPKSPEDDFNELQLFVNLNHLGNKVIFTGPKNRDEIPQLLMGADCLVLARPESVQADYGFPTKLGEYLATKKPVVVTAVGEIPFYLKDNVSAFMARPDDADHFAEKLYTAYSDPSFAAQVGMNGYEVAKENFDSKILADKILENLEQNT